MNSASVDVAILTFQTFLNSETFFQGFYQFILEFKTKSASINLCCVHKK